MQNSVTVEVAVRKNIIRQVSWEIQLGFLWRFLCFAIKGV